MKKKKYIKPSMEVYEMKPSFIICGSQDWNKEIGYLPTVPGSGDDEKHLA